ncbi:hypothetical protein PoB_003875700 [Plakobranchus ocellatus]|uniref:Uncharacterized protein n=1 Tax=Plakobranchus ocellatus TaxID=259542 RepID=A0AAV4AZ00_9GAST|nr:hypothetical protein PoB_003875700 [Plakobranchus ocellatus]
MRVKLTNEEHLCEPYKWCSEQILWIPKTSDRMSIATVNFKVKSEQDYGTHRVTFLRMKDNDAYVVIAKHAFTIYRPVTIDTNCTKNGTAVPAKIGDFLGLRLCLPNNSFGDVDSSLYTTRHGRWVTLDEYNEWDPISYFWRENSIDNDNFITLFLKVTSDRAFKRHKIAASLESEAIIYDINVFKQGSTRGCLRRDKISSAKVGDIIGFIICFEKKDFGDLIGVNLHVDDEPVSCERDVWCDDKRFWAVQSSKNFYTVNFNFAVRGDRDFKTHRFSLKYKVSDETITKNFELVVFKKDEREACLKWGKDVFLSGKVGDVRSIKLCLPKVSASRSRLTLKGFDSNEMPETYKRNQWMGGFFWTRTASSATVNIKIVSVVDYRHHNLRLLWSRNVRTMLINIYKSVSPIPDVDCRKERRVFPARINETVSFQLCLRKTVSKLVVNAVGVSPICERDTWCSKKLFWAWHSSKTMTVNIKIQSDNDFRKHVFRLRESRSIEPIDQFEIHVYKSDATDGCFKNELVIPADVGKVISFKRCFPKKDGLLETLQIYSNVNGQWVAFQPPNIWGPSGYFWTSEAEGNTTVVTLNIRISARNVFKTHKIRSNELPSKTYSVTFSNDESEPGHCEKVNSQIPARDGDLLSFAVCLQSLQTIKTMSLISNFTKMPGCPTEVWCSGKWFWRQVIHGNVSVITVNLRVENDYDYTSYHLLADNQSPTVEFGFDVYKEATQACSKNRMTIAAKQHDLVSFQVCLDIDIDLTGILMKMDSEKKEIFLGSGNTTRSRWLFDKSLFSAAKKKGDVTIVTVNVRISNIKLFSKHSFLFRASNKGTTIFDLSIYSKPDTDENCARKQRHFLVKSAILVSSRICLNSHDDHGSPLDFGYDGDFTYKPNIWYPQKLFWLPLEEEEYPSYLVNLMITKDRDVQRHSIIVRDRVRLGIAARYFFDIYKEATEDRCLEISTIVPITVGDVLSLQMCIRNKSSDFPSRKVIIEVEGHWTVLFNMSSWILSKYFWTAKENETAANVTINIKVASDNDLNTYRIASYLSPRATIYNVTLLKPVLPPDLCSNQIKGITAEVGSVYAFQYCFSKANHPLGPASLPSFSLGGSRHSCAMSTWCQGKFVWTITTNSTVNKILINFRPKSEHDLPLSVDIDKTKLLP